MKPSLYATTGLLVASLYFLAHPLHADVLCVKKRKPVQSGKVTLRNALVVASECPRGFKEILNTESFLGTDGAQGPAGSDGRDGAWGDGSAGARIVLADETFDDDNLQYTNFTVNSGVTLTIASGTTIRCTGTFTNNGTITVSPHGEDGTNATDGVSFAVDANRGLARRAPTQPFPGDNSTTRVGGVRGLGMDLEAARNILHPPIYAGGSGSVALGSSSAAGQGGGSMAIYAEGGIVNAGLISASGGSGGNCSGGGAGGVLILASAGNIDNSGTLRSIGGTGGAFTATCASGGGGSGGLIHVLAQSFSPVGTIQLTGGSGIANQAAGTVSAGTRSGGGGGGALIGDGGNGSSTATNGSTSGSGSATGDDGTLLQRLGFNPAGML